METVFFTACSGICDAIEGILRGRDAACHVSTSTASSLLKRIALLICGLFCAATMYAQDFSGTTGSLIWSISGSLIDAKVTQKAHRLLNREALRVIKASPKWTPGMQHCRHVKVKYEFPLIFSY